MRALVLRTSLYHVLGPSKAFTSAIGNSKVLYIQVIEKSYSNNIYICVSALYTDNLTPLTSGIFSMYEKPRVSFFVCTR